MRLVPCVVAVETELLTTKTFNVVASHVFLYSLLACRTLTRVLPHPLLVILLLISQFLPFFDLFTHRRFMRLLLTLKTIGYSTGTLNYVLRSHYVFLAKEGTAIGGAVAHTFVDYRIVDADLFAIKLGQGIGDFLYELQKYRVGWTGRVHT